MQLKNMEDRYGETLVNLAISYVFEKGMKFCQAIKDEEIESLKGSSMFPQEKIQTLVKLARDISFLNLRSDILPYIKEDMYLTSDLDFKGKSDRYSVIAKNAIEAQDLTRKFKEKDLLKILCCEREDLESILGYAYYI